MKSIKTPGRSGSSKENLCTDPVEVYCRVRPLSDEEGESCARVISETSIQLYPPQSYKGPNKQTENSFTYVYDTDSSQREVFDRSCFQVVDDLIHGKNGLLFTYGITGSGKTFTMTGTPRESGVLPRSLDVLFNSIKELQSRPNVFRPDAANGFDIQNEDAAAQQTETDRLLAKPPATPGRKGALPGADEWDLKPRCKESARIRDVDEDNAYAVFVSYVEIYNNYVYDLLDNTFEKGKLPSRGLREDLNRHMYVSNVTEVEVKNTDDAFKAFVKGQQLRRVAHTALNTESSRSHSVFNIRLVQAPLDTTGQQVIQDKSKVHTSQLSLVDLAGSERSSRTNHAGERMRETSCINTSLMVLRQCMEQLRENQRSGGEKLVPYRDSKLTHLFKKYFDGEGKVRMIVCLNPSASDYEENLHVMQFAEMTQEIEVARGTAVNYDSEGLTPGRRRAAQFNWPTQSTPISNHFRLQSMPEIQMQGPSDEQIMMKLREHYETQVKARQEALESTYRRKQEFESAMRKLMYAADSNERKCKELEEDYDLARSENLRLTSENKRIQNQLASVSQRLRKYESEAKNSENQEESLRKKQQEAEFRYRQKEAKLRQVKEALTRGRQIGSSQESLNGGNRGATLGSSSKHGGSIEALSYSKTTRRPPVPLPRHKRAPSPPPKPRVGGSGRHHRRSKSAGGITYEPSQGKFVLPKLRSVKRSSNEKDKDDGTTKRQRL